jgi:hypothetical protein
MTVKIERDSESPFDILLDFTCAQFVPKTDAKRLKIMSIDALTQWLQTVGNVDR